MAIFSVEMEESGIQGAQYLDEEDDGSVPDLLPPTASDDVDVLRHAEFAPHFQEVRLQQSFRDIMGHWSMIFARADIGRHALHAPNQAEVEVHNRSPHKNFHFQ